MSSRAHGRTWWRAGSRGLLLAGGIVAAAATARPAQVADLDLQLAREPATVTTTARREFSGLLDGMQDDRLLLRLATGGGEVGYSFAPDEIAQLALPGADLEAQARELCDRGHWAEALPLLEALGRQRLRYLPVLRDPHFAALRLLVVASSRAGNPLETLGCINQLRPYLTQPPDRALLREAELAAYVELGDADAMRRLATAWCAEADPAGPSALGWVVLAKLAYQDRDFDRARWTALQPVVFSSYLPMEHLDTCYALAISAAHRLNDEAHAQALYSEMRARGLAWPEDPALADIGRHFVNPEAVTPDEAVPADNGSAIVIRPTRAASEPEPSLEDVRKLVHSPTP